jgi:hypothetical protein
MDKITKLTELKKLLDDGLLTQEEFDKFKSKLIYGSIIAEDDTINAKETFESDFSNSHDNSNEQKENQRAVVNEEKTEKDYVQELNSSPTNKSYGRYILSILLFVGFIGVTSYNFYFKEKWANEQKSALENGNTRFTYLTEPIDDLESLSVTGLSNEQELFSYLDEVAIYWCSEWKKAKQFQNENRRFEEMLKVHRCINAYPLGFTEGIIMLNDLPMELDQKATEHFRNKVTSLGFDYYWIEGSSEKHGSLEEEIESFENGRSNEYNEAEYNRQQEQAEYESSQDYYNNEQTKSNPEINKSKAKNTILAPNQIFTYENGSIKYTVEMNSEERISITKFEPNKRTEGWGWEKGGYTYNSNSIQLSWIEFEYTIKKNEMIVLTNGKSKSYLLTNSN